MFSRNLFRTYKEEMLALLNHDILNKIVLLLDLRALATLVI